MGAIGPTELLLIAFVIVLLFGAGRIAEIGKGLGEGIRNFKLGVREAVSDDPEQLPEHTDAEDSNAGQLEAKRSRKGRVAGDDVLAGKTA